MKRYKQTIKAASESESPYDAMVENLEADIEYIIDGFDKLQRSGLEKEAIRIGAILEDAINSVDNEISNIIGG